MRFRYALHSETPVRLTKPAGTDVLDYLSVSLAEFDRIREVRFSEFSSLFHTFCPSEHPVDDRHFENDVRLMGPLLVASGAETAPFLIAYEHGSQVPDAFLAYDLAPDRTATLRAVKGNYYDGQIVGPDRPFGTPWFQIAGIDGDEDTLAAAYREYVLTYLTPNAESRKPYIFYNTWNFQERNRWWYKNAYLDSMNEERMLQEIDVAHRMGIDVFVLDTGWYEKTGDWHVSAARFPRGLGPIKEKLDGYGMKLGLWFNPTVAAVSSRMHREHRDCLMTRDNKPHDPHEVWETEASQSLCLVSRYGDAFADELIRLVREVGVTYFKWDAIGQYGCDAAGHGHGTEANTPEERRVCYGFQLGAAMARVVDKLCAACPEAIVDFDITEGGRTVGLQFLASGKYFLINNGPYNHDFQMPVPADGNVNLFFYPGPARAWICRAPLGYDKWLPSVLFLTHYLPDDVYTRHGWGGNKEVTDPENQWISIASLVLGQNGIWGDLLRITDAGVARFGHALGLYKQVRDDITVASPVRVGAVGGSPEVHEKINAANGRGVVCLFASASGSYTYVTENRVAPGVWHNDGVTVTHDPRGRARIDARFDTAGAKIVFFGVREGM
uniref:GH36 n=1 Tax=uncultured Armatimonadetes bacterium TaxID=157466 RepID=A0A6J4I1A7_9BACT|nr:GH36 [uncultured Armatimonadetes bacterium]